MRPVPAIYTRLEGFVQSRLRKPAVVLYSTLVAFLEGIGDNPATEPHRELSRASSVLSHRHHGHDEDGRL